MCVFFIKGCRLPVLDWLNPSNLFNQVWAEQGGMENMQLGGAPQCKMENH